MGFSLQCGDNGQAILFLKNTEGVIFIFRYILGAGADACPYFPVTWWFYSRPANELIIDPTMNISCTSGSYSLKEWLNNIPVTPAARTIFDQVKSFGKGFIFRKCSLLALSYSSEGSPALAVFRFHYL
jgi:hypothetical protein